MLGENFPFAGHLVAERSAFSLSRCPPNCVDLGGCKQEVELQGELQEGAVCAGSRDLRKDGAGSLS